MVETKLYQMNNCTSCIDPEMCMQRGSCLHKFMEKRYNEDESQTDSDIELSEDEGETIPNPYGVAIIPSGLII